MTTQQLLILLIATSSTLSDATNFVYTKTEQAKAITINCGNNDVCNIMAKSSAESGLRSSTINCPSNKDCSVTCDARFSCYETTINCPQSADCIIKCNEFQSCGYITVNGPSSGNLLQINCDSKESCHDSQINAFNNVDGKVDISCNKDIPNTPQEHGLYRSKISCPLNGECLFDTFGIRALRKAAINATMSKSLKITVQGDRALEEAKVYCPKNVGQKCLVDIVKSKLMLVYAEFYAVESFKDLKVMCDGKECADSDAIGHEHLDVPKLFCKEEYDGVCELRLLNGKWFCEEENECGIEVAPEVPQHSDL